MDAREAREHLDMVDRILTTAEKRPYRPMGSLFVVWGLGAAFIDISAQFSHGVPLGAWAVAGAIVLALALAYTIFISVRARRRADRMPNSEARMGRILGAVWLAIWVCSLCQPHMFSGWASAAIWNTGAAISLLAPGFFGDRRALFGGIVLLASVVVANAWFAYAGFALAAGFLIGYVSVGILYMIQNARYADCG